jgi:hypothetical protein
MKPIVVAVAAAGQRMTLLEELEFVYCGKKLFQSKKQGMI